MIKFFNHACFYVQYNEVKLLVDPYINGSAFNDGWNLITESEYNVYIGAGSIIINDVKTDSKVTGNPAKKI